MEPASIRSSRCRQQLSTTEEIAHSHVVNGDHDGYQEGDGTERLRPSVPAWSEDDVVDGSHPWPWTPGMEVSLAQPSPARRRRMSSLRPVALWSSHVFLTKLLLLMAIAAVFFGKTLKMGAEAQR